MHTKNLLKLLLVVLVVANTGCAVQDRAVLFRAQGTAPHDPPRGRDLFEQLPNWDNAAQVRCGSHLRPQDRKPGQTDQC
jgi:hypothetical protein